MADRNEIFRIILEGRDKLSGQLNNVRKSVESLDSALTKLKRNKVEEFPLFGGGKATRGPGGQFIRVEEISRLDQARRKVDALGRSIRELRQQRIKEGEFPLFGGGRAVRGEGGQFVRAQDLTKLQQAAKVFRGIDETLGSAETKARRLLLGGGTTDPKRDPSTGRFVSNLTIIGKTVEKIRQLNQETEKTVGARRRELAGSFRQGFQIAKQTRENIEAQVAATQRDFKEKKLQLKVLEDQRRTDLTAEQQGRRLDLQKELFDLDQVDKARKRRLREIGKLKREELTFEHEKEVANIINRLVIEENKKRDLFDFIRSGNKALKQAAISDVIDIINFEKSERRRERQQEFTSEFQGKRQGIGAEFTQKRLDLERPDLRAIAEREIQIRKEQLETVKGFQRVGVRAGLAFGDIVRGARAARSGVRNLERDTNLVTNAFTRFGFAVGNVFKNFGQLVNLRWVFITGILTLFFTILVQVGTALVSVAASAVQAAGALGGAFLAAITQALPVVGLLAAAFSRFNAVLDAVKLDEKIDDSSAQKLDNIRNASQRLEDSQFSLKKAIEGVADAQFGLREANRNQVESLRRQKDAVRDLAEARLQAARDIVESNFAERDAALSLKEAELAVVQAKERLLEIERKQRGERGDQDEAAAALREANERLRIAKAQGDEAEISSAQQQVTIAEQNLNAILDQVDSSKTELKDAQLSVQRSQLSLEQARVRNTQAQKDAQRDRSRGIEGSEIVRNALEQLRNANQGVADAQRSVLLANRNIRDALHQVAVAHREVADAQRDKTEATKGSTAADEAAKKAFADLSPAEKKLFTSLKRIRDTFKRVFSGTSERDGILAPITLAISRLVDQLEKMLRNPRIQRAIQNLANSLGKAIDKFTAFISTASAQEDLIFFIESAANNIPKIVQGTLDLFKILLNVARAATPLFNRLLDRFTGALSRARGLGTRRPPASGEVAPEGLGGVRGPVEQSKIESFLAGAEKHLDSWINLGAAIGNVVLALSASPASASGKSLIDTITVRLNDLSAWIRENPDKIRKFFEDNRLAFENLAKVLGRLGAALVKAFGSKEFAAFGQVMAEIIIPGLLLFIFALGQASRLLIAITEIPFIGDIIKWALAVAVAEKAFNKILPVTQKLTTAIKLGLVGAFRLFRREGITGLVETFRLKMMYARDAAVRLASATKNAAIAAFNLGKRGAKAAAEGLITLASRAKDAAIAVGTTLLGALRRAAAFMIGRLIFALKLLRLNIRLLIASTGIGALIVAGLLLIENWDKVKKAADKLWQFLKRVFGQIVTWIKDHWKLLAGILLAPFAIGGLVIATILRFKDRILTVFKTIKQGIINRFKEAIEWVKTKIGEMASWVENKLKSIPGIGRFFSGGDRPDLTKEQKSAETKKIVDLLPKKAQAQGRALLEAGENSLRDFLNALIKKKLITTQQAVEIGNKIAGNVLFAQTGAVVPGRGSRDTVPAMLTPGEWVVNSTQQRKLASALGISIQQAKAFIFGTNSSTAPTPNTASRSLGGGRGRGGAGAAKNNQLGKKIEYYRDFNLVSQEDPDGQTVWFLELKNGTFGQVTGRDAKRIQASNGEWIPNYVKRSAAGFKQNVTRIVTGGISGFSLGGVVTPSSVQRFAAGGVVQAPGHGTTSNQKNIYQNFDVKTQGETDWGYVMRLGAVAAQEAF